MATAINSLNKTTRRRCRKAIRARIVRALRFLNQAIPEEWQALSIDDLLAQAVANWQPAKSSILKWLPLSYD
ncbi:glutamyl-Q-tRNA synthetase [Klebsiella pneumoniae]|nr:glutamyl-Q-tRNA synthetase [Klebsiella pneumoniae]